MSVVYSNNFDADTTGALPSGWANAVGTWVVGTTAPVSGSKTLGSSSNGDGDVTLYTGSAAIADMQVDTRQIAVAASSNFPLIGHILRSDGSNSNHYVVLFTNVTAASGQCLIFKKVSGSYTMIHDTGLQAAFGVTGGAGVTVCIRTRIVGSTIEVGFAVGSTPSSWVFSKSDGSITAAGYPGLYNGKDGKTITMAADDFIFDDTATGASAVTLSGPSTGTTGSPSTNFTVGANGAITGTVTVTPSDSGGGGTFAPTSVNISSGSPTATFTYTAASNGAHSISVTNGGGLSNPSALTYTSASGAATAVTMSGPSSGVSGVASTNFTVGANGSISGTVVVTPSSGGGGGTFTPMSVSISSGTPTATFTYTPASAGAKTISVTNNGGLTNPSNITYTATAPAIYDQVNATDTIGGQNIMVLVPNSNSGTPYNAAVPTRVILYAHGAGENQTGLLSDSLKATTVTALLNAGYILAGTNAHGENWGSQAAVDDYAALDKYVRDNYNVAGVAIWSQSMGGLAGLSALMQGKVKALGWLGTYPVCSLANLYSLGTYTSAINTAYGITGSGNATYANKTYGLDPATRDGFSWRHVPMRFYASAGDTVVPKANNTDVLAALVAGCCREADVVVCTGNHGDASHFQPSDTLSFFDRCFATPVALGRPASTKTISITLTSNGTTPASGLTGLKWAFYDQATPAEAEYPVDKGTAESTDGSGVLAITVRTNLASGGVGWLVVTDSDGTTTQSPPHKRFAGPVQVT